MDLEVEKNCSDNTLIDYEYELNSLVTFLESHNRSLDTNDITKARIRRYI